jgi:catechol 2,3-dioxygenase-like lactoylglutathione lyase family enzyme
VTSLDHSVVAVSDWERSNAFYRDVLGAELIERGARWAYRFGDQQLNVHGPGASGDPATSVPVRPGDSHMCVRWDGAIEEAIEHLARHGLLESPTDVLDDELLVDRQGDVRAWSRSRGGR